MQLPITLENLDTLTDKELLVFYKIIKYKRHNEISIELNIPKNSIPTILNSLYKKLEIKKHRPECLRSAWRMAIEKQKATF